LNILVCVKQVPDTTEIKMDSRTNTLDRSSAATILNPYDAHAVEEAVNLKRKFGGKVTIITMGPPQAKEVIKKCIEMGADDGVLLTDRVFAGSDTLATSYILGSAIKKMAEKKAFDLVFCGKQAIDGDTAQVGPGIASRLGIPQLTYVEKITNLDLIKNLITLHRKLDDGYEIVESMLPCLITVEKCINELSYSSLPNMIKGARFNPKIWNANNLDADMNQMGLKGSATSVRKIFPPPKREGGEILKGNTTETVKIVADKMKEEIIACRS